MKGRYALLVTVIAVCIVGGGFVIGIEHAIGADQYYQFGVKDASLKSSGAQGEIVAGVNGVPISRFQVEQYRALAAMNNALSQRQIRADTQAAFQALVTQAALVAEARRRGLSPSQAELMKYIDQVRQQIMTTPEAKAQFERMLAGLGLSAEQYFADPNVIEGYRRALEIARLRGQVVQGFSSGQSAKQWQTFQEEIRSSADVKITSPEFEQEIGG